MHGNDGCPCIQVAVRVKPGAEIERGWSAKEVGTRTLIRYTQRSPILG